MLILRAFHQVAISIAHKWNNAMNVNDVKTKGMKYFTLFKGAQKDSRAKDQCHRRSKYICMNKIEQFGFLIIQNHQH